MRCFVAINIDENVRREIGEVAAGLRRESGLKASEVKWVEPENIHLTLKFLGEVSDSRIGDVCRIVEDAVSGRSGFSIDVAGIGWFGRPARVLWAGVREQGELSALWRAIDERLAEAGWGKDAKGFTGHLTLCRIKSARAGRGLEEAASELAGVELGRVDVESVCVYRSELTRSGPVYTVVSRSFLADSR